MRKSNRLADIDNLRRIVAESFSLKEVREKLGYKASGGMYVLLRRYFILYNIDISHFKSIWNKGKTRIDDSRLERQAKTVEYSWEYAFSYGSKIENGSLLKRLIVYGKKQYKCEVCGISEWKGKPLRLQIDHKDGDRLNNAEENLLVVCPNCHSQTETFSRGKRNIYVKCPWWHHYTKCSCGTIDKMCSLVNTKKNYCIDCKSKIGKTKHGRCFDCQSKIKRKVARPDIKILKKQIKELGFCGTSRLYGVSDNAIRKWVKE